MISIQAASTDDLGLKLDNCPDNIGDLEHELIQAFIRKRTASPVGIEKVQPLTTRSEVYTIHLGRSRGATWHDRERDVVWLLAVRIHRSGKRDDAYPYFKALDASGNLFPDVVDFEWLFEAEDRDFAQKLIAEAGAFRGELDRAVNQEVHLVVADRIRVRGILEREEGLACLSVAISLRLMPGDQQIPSDWLPVILAALFPGVHDPFQLSMSHTWSGAVPARDELVFSQYLAS